MGPILFLLYINDIGEVCHEDSIFKLFADDVKLFSDKDNHSPSPSSSLQLSLDNLAVWSRTWQLDINIKKCHILSISSVPINPTSQTYSLNGSDISPSSTSVDLGITVSGDLSYKAHINNIVAAAYRRQSIFFRGFISRDLRIVRQAFITYIRPILEYNSVIWNPTEVYLVDALENVLRSYTRRIPCLSHLPYTTRLSLIKLESLEIRRLRFDLIYYYKVLGNLTPLNPNDYFIIHRTNPASRSYPIYLLKPPKVTNKLSSSFFFRNTNVFNDLPHDLKSATSLASFKNGLNSVDFSKYLKGSAFR